MFVNITRYGRKDDPKLTKKEMFHYEEEEGEAPVKLASKVKEYYHFFLSSNYNH